MSTNPNLIIFGGELAADLRAMLNQLFYSFTVSNEEPSGSPNFINTLNLEIVTPFTVVGTPPGWEFETDNSTYILWSSIDQAHEIAPGDSLAGFKIQTTSAVVGPIPFTLTAFDHTTDQPGDVLTGSIAPIDENRICLQAISNGDRLSFDRQSGAYSLSLVNGFMLTGTGAVKTKGCVVTLTQGPNENDRKLLVKTDTCLNKGTASVQYFPIQLTVSIIDENLSEFNCT